MRWGVSLAVAFVLLIALSACSSPEEPPIRAVNVTTMKAVDSEEARQVVDEFVAALSTGDIGSLDGLLCGRALETSPTLAGVTSATLLSVTEDPAAEGSKSPARVFELQCDVDYAQRAGMDQSGVYVYRLRILRTPQGVRIENIGP